MIDPATRLDHAAEHLDAARQAIRLATADLKDGVDRPVLVLILDTIDATRRFCVDVAAAVRDRDGWR